MILMANVVSSPLGEVIVRLLSVPEDLELACRVDVNVHWLGSAPATVCWAPLRIWAVEVGLLFGNVRRLPRGGKS
jgi:hypothetical protein